MFHEARTFCSSTALRRVPSPVSCTAGPTRDAQSTLPSWVMSEQLGFVASFAILVWQVQPRRAIITMGDVNENGDDTQIHLENLAASSLAL